MSACCMCSSHVRTRLTLYENSRVTSVPRVACRQPATLFIAKCKDRSTPVLKDVSITWRSNKRLRHVAAAAGALTGNGGQLRASFEEVTVEEVMNPHPVLLTADMAVKDAVRLFLEKDISGAPVVDKTGNLVGVISESDLIWKGVGTPQDHFIVPPFYIGLADLMVSWRDNVALEEEIHKILARTVGEAMNSHPVSVQPSMPMSEAATLMVKKKINRLPVLEDGKVVGVITRHDVLMGLVASNSPLL